MPSADFRIPAGVAPEGNEPGSSGGPWYTCSERYRPAGVVTIAITDVLQGAKESRGWMAGGARMASQGLPGLQDTKVTWEKPASLEHQVKSFSFSPFL